MRVMIVEDQVMIRGLLETYFTKEIRLWHRFRVQDRPWSFAEPDRWILY